MALKRSTGEQPLVYTNTISGKRRSGLVTIGFNTVSGQAGYWTIVLNITQYTLSSAGDLIPFKSSFSNDIPFIDAVNPVDVFDFVVSMINAALTAPPAGYTRTFNALDWAAAFADIRTAFSNTLTTVLDSSAPPPLIDPDDLPDVD